LRLDSFSHGLYSAKERTSDAEPIS
jgi:hypothetical protein